MIALLLLCLVAPSTTFFFPGAGGSGCGCQSACPPPAPPPVCAPQPAPACPSYPPCHAVVHAAKTAQASPLPMPDELELRAAAFGIPVHSFPIQEPTAAFRQLERLVDRQYDRPQEALAAVEIKEKEDDADLFANLRHTAEIRRAPQIKVTNEVAETTTVAAEVEKVKGEESHTITDNKCNSQILKKLMLENMSDNSSESKRKVNLAAETKFGGSVDVICSRGHFSYVFSSNLYCETTKGLVTCIAFRQAV